MEIKQPSAAGRRGFAVALAKASRGAGPGAKVRLETCLESRTPPQAAARVHADPLSAGKRGEKETKSDLIALGERCRGSAGAMAGSLNLLPREAALFKGLEKAFLQKKSGWGALE